MRQTHILPLILIMTACSPTAPVPTTTPFPPTVTVTSAPSSTSTTAPTATSTQEPTATSTQEPTATATMVPTSEPSPTTTPDSLPEGVKSLQVAEETGWKWENGEWRQHVVMNEKGEVLVAGGVRLSLLEEPKCYTDEMNYHIPMINGKDYFMEYFHHVKIPPERQTCAVAFKSSKINTAKYFNSLNGGNGYYLEVVLDDGSFFQSGNGAKNQIPSVNSCRTDDRDPIGVFVLYLSLPKDAKIKEVKLAQKYGEPLYKVYDSKESRVVND